MGWSWSALPKRFTSTERLQQVGEVENKDLISNSKFAEFYFCPFKTKVVPNLN